MKVILFRLDHFCGIYGASIAEPELARSPAFILISMKARVSPQNTRKYISLKLTKMAADGFVERKDIEITQGQHKISHFY